MGQGFNVDLHVYNQIIVQFYTPTGNMSPEINVDSGLIVTM